MTLGSKRWLKINDTGTFQKSLNFGSKMAQNDGDENDGNEQKNLWYKKRQRDSVYSQEEDR